MSIAVEERENSGEILLQTCQKTPEETAKIFEEEWRDYFLLQAV